MNSFFLPCFGSIIISFLVTFFLIPIVSSLAQKFRFVDVPDGKIKIHKEVVPYLGGVAVYCGFLCGLAFSFPFGQQIILLLIGITLLLVLGLFDDLLVLTPSQKFIGQCIATLCFIKGGLYLKEHIFYNMWNIVISSLWILSIINGFNLVDVMDGLSTTIAIFASINFMAIAYLLGQYDLLLILGSFLGSLIAFLWYNKPNASIYMGDAGSLFMGGFLGVVPFLFKWGTYNAYGYMTPPVVLAIPILEVICLIIIRKIKKIPFYQGSPDHFSSYLQAAKWSKNAILVFVAFISLLLGSVAVAFVMNKISVLCLIQLGALFAVFWGFFLYSMAVVALQKR